VDAIIRLRGPAPRPLPPLPPGLVERAYDPASLADIDAFVDVHNEAFQGIPFTGPATRETMLASARLPAFDAGLIKLIDDQEGAAGFLRGAVERDVGQIEVLGLLPRARGRGAGRWLLRRAEELLRAEGATSIVLSVVASNTPARSLYASEGYVEEERRIVWERELRVDRAR
jgi:mycothiol synthase